MAPPLRADAIPLDWDQVTPEWMSARLQRDFPGCEVSDARLVMRDDGTNRRARIALTFSAGRGPETVFLKAHAAANRMVHLRNGNLWNEARLFQADLDLPVPHPRVHDAIVDLLGLDFLLVMEDVVAGGGDPRDATRPMSVNQVEDAVRSLAQLHASYWALDKQALGLDWLQDWEPTQGWQQGLLNRIPLGLERARSFLPPEVAAMDAGQIVESWARYIGMVGSAPMTLTHGDLHIGNTYVLPGDRVGFLDWQVVRRGRWSIDFAYFIGGALVPEDRRTHSMALLEAYRAGLSDAGADAPSLETMASEYRAAHAHGLAIWLSTLGTDGWQDRAICEALAKRYALAFVEDDTIAALDEIAA